MEDILKETTYYAQLDNEGKILGFYLQGIHGEQVCNQIYTCGGLKLNEEIWKELVSYGVAKFNGAKEDRIYTMSDLALFEKVIPPVDNTPRPKSELEIIKEKQAIQEQSLLELSMLIGGAK